MNIEVRALIASVLISGTVLGGLLGAGRVIRPNGPAPVSRPVAENNPIKDPRIAAGARLYFFNCAHCHGDEGEGGVPNPNAKTAELVPGLIRVSEGYTNEELKDRILKGQREIPVIDPNRPPPPLYMPGWRGRISDAEVNDLVAYLSSLKPGERESGF
jgi:mono/diheme cytochrome c family protein